MTFTGRVFDVGDMEEGRGIRVDIGGQVIVLAGLSIAQMKILGDRLGEVVTIEVRS